jgi:hypothetical protein
VTRPQARELTQTPGPGTAWFVCLPVRLREGPSVRTPGAVKYGWMHARDSTRIRSTTAPSSSFSCSGAACATASATCSAVCSTSTGELHERVCAPFRAPPSTAAPAGAHPRPAGALPKDRCQPPGLLQRDTSATIVKPHTHSYSNSHEPYLRVLAVRRLQRSGQSRRRGRHRRGAPAPAVR